MKKNLFKLPISALLSMLILVFALNAVNAQKININASSIEWKGYHLAKSYEHVGNVKIKSGEVTLKDGILSSGKVVIDMTSISNNDLEGGKNDKLVNHLNSEEFFYTSKYPEATLVITKAKKSGGNYDVEGEIEIRGLKQIVSFNLSQSEKSFDGTLTVDRTKHEVMYGWTLENAMLSNNFDLKFHIELE